MITFLRLAPAFALLGLSGCAAVVGDVRPFAPMSAPAVAIAAPPAPASDGAIYPGSRALRLFEDNKARGVGDLVTYRLVATNTAGSITDPPATAGGKIPRNGTSKTPDNP